MNYGNILPAFSFCCRAKLLASAAAAEAAARKAARAKQVPHRASTHGQQRKLEPGVSPPQHSSSANLSTDPSSAAAPSSSGEESDSEASSEDDVPLAVRRSHLRSKQPGQDLNTASSSGSEAALDALLAPVVCPAAAGSNRATVREADRSLWLITRYKKKMTKEDLHSLLSQVWLGRSSGLLLHGSNLAADLQVPNGKVMPIVKSRGFVW